jgi:hypothetical protein
MEIAARYLNLNQIRIDGGTQSRHALDQETIEEYKEAMLAGAAFPPVDVFFDGDAYWLADGFHRYEARSAAGKLRINANVHSGTLRDAVLFSIGANAFHGLRRRRADKQKAVFMLLQDPEWSRWSDNVLSMKANVSQVMVSDWRRRLVPIIGEQNSVRIDAKGNLRDTANVGFGVNPKRPRGTIGTRQIIESLERIDQQLDRCPQYRPVQVLVRQAMTQLIDLMSKHQMARIA